MQNNNRNIKQSGDKQNRQIMTIAAVAFTLLACFFLVFLFLGPRQNNEPVQPQAQTSVQYPTQQAKPAQNPAPNIDLKVTEQNPNAASSENPQPDANAVTQNGNDLTIPLESDSNTAKPDESTAQQSETPVKPEPAKPVAVPPAKPAKTSTATENPGRNAASKGSFKVQAGAYASKANADKLAADLRNKGYSVEIQSSLAESLTLYRVVIGSFKTREDAQKLATELNAKGNSASVISSG